MPSEHLSENGSENLSFSESDSQTLYDHEGKPLRRLRWNESNHFAIMTQIKGSVIPRVIPYCIVNGIMTYVIYELKQKGVKDITSNPSGHKYLAVIMSFLLVTRVKIIYDRYMHNATSLTNLNKACREIGQMTVTLTDADKSERAARWRHDVVYAAIVMLRVTVAVLEFQANPEQMPWDLPEMDQDQQQGMQESLFVSKFRLNVPKDDGDDEEGNNEQARQQSQPSLLKHTSDEQRTKLEEACRAPIVLAYNCRREIMKQRDGTWLDRPKHGGIFASACHERQLGSFSLLALQQPSDFDDLGLAQLAFEDIYLAIYKCDGEKWAKKLRDRVLPHISANALLEFHRRHQENWNPRSALQRSHKKTKKTDIRRSAVPAKKNATAKK
eukprot:scaffold7349_cov173-Amphora_coffeaeformis.AAC.29